MDKYVCIRFNLCGIDEESFIGDLAESEFFVPEDGDLYGFWRIDGSLSFVFDGVYNCRLIFDDKESFIRQVFLASGEVNGKDCTYVYVCFDATCKPNIFRVVYEAGKVLEESGRVSLLGNIQIV